MSMRVGNGTEASVINNARSAEAKTAGSASSTGHMQMSSPGGDEVSLSGASSLASLAKTLTPQNKQAKISALTSQVRSGQYRADAAEVSRSIIQRHLES